LEDGKLATMMRRVTQDWNGWKSVAVILLVAAAVVLAVGSNVASFVVVLASVAVVLGNIWRKPLDGGDTR
jgi:hypothetical protein